MVFPGHLEQSDWERFPLSHQPQYGPFEEIPAATLLSITPRNISKCVPVAL